MKKTLITGGAGFIGSHLCTELVNSDYKVTCLDNLYRFNKNKISNLINQKNFNFKEIDIRNRKELSPILDDIDIVVHLAAQSNVTGSIENKDYSFETNVVGTWNLLREAQKNDIDKFIFASSREIYGDTKQKATEDTPMDPNNFYGASKASAEHYLKQFNNQTNLNTISLRIGNVYGPGDKNRVIPIFLKNATKNKPLTLYGGEQILDFVWIKDVIKTIKKTIKTDISYNKINVGSGKGTKIKELAKTIKNITNSNSKITKKKKRDYETKKCILNIKRMKKLGIKPTKLKKGLKQTQKQIKK